mgnify:CR=1 FL=1
MDKQTFRLTLPVLLLASPAAAQVALPSVPLPTGTLGRSIERVTRVANPVLADAGRTLAAVRARSRLPVSGSTGNRTWFSVTMKSWIIAE